MPLITCQNETENEYTIEYRTLVHYRDKRGVGRSNGTLLSLTDIAPCSIPAAFLKKDKS
jgi:hypothetical protein